ncbi:hypothetical protein BpHYR1_042287 [Brachionus plicatilis]|uniref:Uncharacterized protein n=1 Tax=Brachionus plicatilis TaxID=10195 RepID=A0A3M7R4Z1_BRAPC|nr:hypothetical protein BpHYR1_042287 [Brachionus plicatilis]
MIDVNGHFAAQIYIKTITNVSLFNDYIAEYGGFFFEQVQEPGENVADLVVSALLAWLGYHVDYGLYISRLPCKVISYQKNLVSEENCPK